MVGLACVSLLIFGLITDWTVPAPPLPTPTAIPDPERTDVPRTWSELMVPKPDIALSASAPTRLEAPNISFDSHDFLGQGVPLMKWTQEMDDANDKVIRPDPWPTAVIWDASTNHGCGGIPGTEPQSQPFCILAHTSPESWGQPAPFNSLRKLVVGDPIAVTTDKGRLCYTVVSSETILKGVLDDTLKARLAAGTAADGWLITCNRPDDWPDELGTKDNRVVGIQLNQQATNTGTC